MYLAGRAVQFLGLLIAGAGFFAGVFGGNVRRELAMLAGGAAVFFLGRWLQNRS